MDQVRVRQVRLSERRVQNADPSSSSGRDTCPEQREPGWLSVDRQDRPAASQQLQRIMPSPQPRSIARRFWSAPNLLARGKQQRPRLTASRRCVVSPRAADHGGDDVGAADPGFLVGGLAGGGRGVRVSAGVHDLAGGGASGDVAVRRAAGQAGRHGGGSVHRRGPRRSAWLGRPEGLGHDLRRIFAALTGTEGAVVSCRRGVLRRVADELGDLQRVRAQLRQVEADMTAAPG